MKHNKSVVYLLVLFAFVISFIMPSFRYKDKEGIILKAKSNSLDKFISNNYIDKDSVVKLDDNYYSITNDEGHLIDLDDNKLINSNEIIINRDLFNELVFKELRKKYPLFVVQELVNLKYENFIVKSDKIYISYLKDNSISYDVTLICKDYKDLVNYNCVDDVEEDPNITSIDPNKKVVALTFDDGPCIYTEGVIEQLLNFNMKATFFELGSMMERYPEIVKKVKDSGFEIGSHGYSHKSFVKLKTEGTLEELNKTNEIYKGIIGEDLKLVRPPYGAINPTIRDNIPVTFVKWNVDSLDWKVKDERYVQNIMSVVKDGDIILVHDIHKTTLEHLNDLLTKLYNEGFQVVTFSELASVKGANLEVNKVYFKFKNT